MIKALYDATITSTLNHLQPLFINKCKNSIKKMVTLEQLIEYDNYRYGHSDDKKILALILASLGVIGTSGYGVFKLSSHLKSKQDEKKKNKSSSILD